jgi:NAD-specific glutamate dehydrogenase
MSTVFKLKEGKNEIMKSYDKFLQNFGLSYEKFYINTSYGNTFIIGLRY